MRRRAFSDAFVVLVLICATIGFLWFTVDQLFFDPQRRLDAKAKMETLGLPLLKVTVNSPSIWVEIEDFSEFIKLLENQQPKEIYYSRFGEYMIFSENYQVGYRIRYYDVIKNP